MLQQNFLYNGPRNSQQCWLDNGATSSSSQSKWGTYSLNCSSTSSTESAYLITSCYTMFDQYGRRNSAGTVSAAYGTIEYWCYSANNPTAHTFQFDMQNVGTEIAIIERASGGVTYTYARCRFGANTLSTSEATMSLSTWHHVALCFRGLYADFYVDGSLVGTIGNGTDDLVTSGGTPWRLGFSGNNAFYSDLRISSVARYSGSTYTVPTAAFTNDADTYCLFSFDENTSDYFTDDLG